MIKPRNLSALHLHWNLKPVHQELKGLEGLSVRCTACDARATLKGAFDKECFQRMDEEKRKK